MAYYRGATIYLTTCVECGSKTSKSYARQNGGKCKQCVTGIAPEPRYKCPQCGGPLSKYKHDNHYVCEGCYRDNDPLGYANEVRGMSDGPNY